jgi:hypothetical protein
MISLSENFVLLETASAESDVSSFSLEAALADSHVSARRISSFVRHVGDRLCGLVEFLATDPEVKVRFTQLDEYK